MRVVISTSASIPIYEQIKTQVRSAILSGDVPAGSTLPSLRQLAADLRVSVITVTRAYNDLVAEGLVRNEHGRGFVVRDIDPAVAAEELAKRVDTALLELRVAARHARIDIDEIHRRLEEAWRSETDD
ncbi:GntR family transcriptional regulator [Microbacterium caowuchunii]|jgi:GntR family transcriptional regulator|uniref:GntR family transcriptional regulator n=1 Tax=Microbacterium caowuchunii TaxID=2614638 RepID=A0A5N0T881_9MICO|nr:GntR family transcriptional regulator [Microbacterium caowuchunii]KAA9130357.1 GntR family transcriptional regulator [Microbacterium caowuchunii]